MILYWPWPGNFFVVRALVTGHKKEYCDEVCNEKNQTKVSTKILGWIHCKTWTHRNKIWHLMTVSIIKFEYFEKANKFFLEISYFVLIFKKMWLSTVFELYIRLQFIGSLSIIWNATRFTVTRYFSIPKKFKYRISVSSIE